MSANYKAGIFGRVGGVVYDREELIRVLSELVRRRKQRERERARACVR